MKMISVTGAPDSGKTAVACQLARACAKKGKRAVVVFLDSLNPPFSYLISSDTIKKEQAQSLGGLLSDHAVSQNKIWKSACTVMDGKIALLGYLKNDTPGTFPLLTEYCLDRFLAQMQQLDADVVIWDDPTVNDLIFEHIMALDPYTVSVVKPSPKDLSWAVRNNGFSADTVVLNAVTPGQASSLSAVLSSKTKGLPWSDRVNDNMNCMEAFSNVDRKYTKAVTQLLSKIEL